MAKDRRWYRWLGSSDTVKVWFGVPRHREMWSV